MLLAAARLNQHTWWYLARASGLVSWMLITAAVLWGLVVAGRLTKKRPPPAWNLDLHRFLGALAVTFTAVHMLGLAMDTYSPFSLKQLFVPMASTYRPGAVAWGVVALYVLIAIEGTSLMMKHLPRKLWRSVHATSFALFALATIHGLESGTDTRNRLLRDGGLGLILLGTLLAVLRFLLPKWRKRQRAKRGPTTRPTPRPTPRPGPAAGAPPAPAETGDLEVIGAPPPPLP
jgi:hypothetical protein